MCKTQVDWAEGIAILAAVCIAVVVGSAIDWQKERQFRVLNARKEDRSVIVVRDGKESAINIKVSIIFTPSIRYPFTHHVKKDVVVGDICLLEPGEILPVDGLFLRGYNVRCDESAATGESDAVQKAPFEACWAEIIKASSSVWWCEQEGAPGHIINELEQLLQVS